jgi:glutamate racemase
MSGPGDNLTAKNIIGVFDSGLGGLTVLKYLLQELPDYNYIYLGDSARVPYGEKSPDAIYNCTREAMDWLFQSGCNLIIIACNTATSQALRRLQQEYLPLAYPERRILGVIRPLVEYIAKDKKLQTIGLIGTKATIAAAAYQTELHKLRPDLTVLAKSTPLLVPLIEEGWAGKPETKMILKKYLRPLKVKNIQTLILGCTHYPYLYPAIQGILGRRIKVPLPGPLIAASLKNYLARHSELGLSPVASPTNKYYTTDSPTAFRKLGEKFLGRHILELQQISLDKL